jgi:hypothetical protein
MRLEWLSGEAQKGLIEWAKFQHDELLFEGIGSLPSEWAWVAFQLRAAQDLPEWFPKGKWATIKVIETNLMKEAERESRLKRARG